MLNSYLQQTQLLLNDVREARFNLADLTTYVNTARGQIAGKSECVRVYATLLVGPGTQQYPFSSIVFPAGTVGVQGVLNLRLATYVVTGGSVFVTPRPWEWFQRYYIASQQAATPPQVFAQFGQGALGTLWVNRLDNNYTLSLDTVCFPVPLVDDTTAEAIPYLWTDAVPYYAAYFALLTSGNTQAAAEMFKLYQMYVDEARFASNASVMPMNYPPISKGPTPQPPQPPQRGQ